VSARARIPAVAIPKRMLLATAISFDSGGALLAAVKRFSGGWP
jgi:hypothetical protein